MGSFSILPIGTYAASANFHQPRDTTIRNGTWEYALFDTKQHTLVGRYYQPCFECHKPLHEADYVFSLDALTDAAAN